MRLWRMSACRSARLRASGLLRQEATRPAWAVVLELVVDRARREQWWSCGLIALALQVPFVVLMAGRPVPEWLDTSWQVSATLVGLGVALIVFLLQAAAAQSLSSRGAYRAMSEHSALALPASLSLVYLGCCALIEWLGDSAGDQSSLGEAWALSAFLLQLAAFGLSFVRAIDLGSPSGVRRMLEASFTRDLRRATYVLLHRRRMDELLSAACDEAGVRREGFLGGRTGFPVGMRARGAIRDIDLRLPRQLAEDGHRETVTVTATPDGQLDRHHPLLRASSEQLAARLADQAAKAVVVAAEAGGEVDEPSPLESFDDVLGLARRALAASNHRDVEQVLRLTISVLMGLPESYRRWGVPYEAGTVGDAFGRSDERQLFEAVGLLFAELLRTAMRPSVYRPAQMAAGLIDALLDDDVDLLLPQALSLLRRVALEAAATHDSGVIGEVVEQVLRLSAQHVLMVQSRLEDCFVTPTDRATAAGQLERLFAHQATLAQQLIAVHLTEHVALAMSQWDGWAARWHPDMDVEELQSELETTPQADRPPVAAKLADARATLALAEGLRRHRTVLDVSLGAWAAVLAAEGKLSEEQWREVARALRRHPRSPEDAAGRLALMISEAIWQPLDRWLLDALPPQEGWVRGDSQSAARRWALAELVASLAPDVPPPAVDLGLYGPSAAGTLHEDLTELERRKDVWEEVCGEQMAEQVVRARQAIDEAVSRERRRASRELRDAALDTGRVAAYAQQQRDLLRRADQIGHLLQQAGAVERVTGPARGSAPGESWTLRKGPFAQLRLASKVLPFPDPAHRVADQLRAGVLECLTSHAHPAEGEDPIDSAVEAIDQMRRQGESPDAILGPRDAWLRAGLWRDRRWEPEPPVLIDTDGRPRPMGQLAGVAVYDALPVDADALVILTLGRSIRRVDAVGGDGEALQVHVTPIERSAAGQLARDAGHRPGSREWVKHVVDLVFHHVQAEVWTHSTFVLADSPAPIVACALPPREERRERWSYG